MKHLFNSKSVTKLWVLLLVLLMVKSIWFFVALAWLPTSGVEHAEEKRSKSLFYRVKLSPNKAPAPVVTKKPVKKKGNIKEIKLLAIYNASDITVVTIEYKKKTKVLGKGDEINGFILVGAGSHFALFSKNGTEYKVPLHISTKNKGSIKEVLPSKITPVKKEKSVKGEIVDVGDRKIVDKSLLEHYGSNLKDIYKDIGIKDIKKGKKLEGFSISFIRKGSPFAQLGLKKGDVLESINGQKIDSYNTAFEMYKNIGNIENMTLGITRGKKEMELEYEVN